MNARPDSHRIRTQSDEASAISRLRRWAPWAVAFGAIAAMAATIARYALPVPWRENWQTTFEALQVLDSGKPLLPWLWSPLSENRWFIGRLIDLVNLHLDLTRTPALLYFQLAIALGAAIWAGFLARRTLSSGASHQGWIVWCLPAIVCVATSPSSLENWLWGGYTPVYVEAFFLLGGLFCLAAYPERWWSLAVAALCGVGSILCYSAGLLYFPVVLAVIVGMRLWPVGGGNRATPLHRSEPLLDIPTLTRAGLWFALTVAAWLLYRGGATPPVGIPAVTSWIALVPKLVWFFFAILGNPIGLFLFPYSLEGYIGIPLFGVAGVLIVAATAWRLYRYGVGPPLVWGWLGIAGYTMLTAAVTGIARQEWGINIAMSSRYGAHMWLFWAAVCVLGLSLMPARVSLPRSRPVSGTPVQRLRASVQRWLWRKLAALMRPEVVLVAFFIFWVATYNTRMQRWVGTLRDRTLAVSELPDLCQGNAELLNTLGPEAMIAQTLPTFVQRGLVVLPVATLPAHVDDTPAIPPGALETVRLEPRATQWNHERCLRLAGWAGLEREVKPAEQVWIAARGSRLPSSGVPTPVLKRAWVGHHRPHVGDDYELDTRRAVGWTAYVDPARIPPQAETLELYAIVPGVQRPTWFGRVVLKDALKDTASGRGR